MEIRELAARAVDEGWSWDAGRREGLGEVDAEIAALAVRAAADLSDSDRKRFAGYVPVFERPGDSPDLALARAKMMHLLGSAIENERFTRLLDRPLHAAPVFQKFPELRNELDEADLLPASCFRPLADAFEYQRHAVAFSEFTPYRLCRKLLDVASQVGGGELRWRVSGRAAVPIAEYRPRLEEAIDFGLPFRDDLILQRLWKPHLPTVLRREPPTGPAEEAYDHLNPVERLEVLRTERGDHISFLFEELVPLAERHIEVGYVSTRIFHCDTAQGSGLFSHVDSSCLIYRLETYERRLASKMKDKVKAEGHLKLFWLDSCPVDPWKELLSLTYPRNELVAEYLTGVRSRRPNWRPRGEEHV